MEVSTLQGKDNLRNLGSEKVEKINIFFDKLNNLVSDLYEAIFDEEDIDDIKKEITDEVKAVKLKDFVEE